MTKSWSANLVSRSHDLNNKSTAPSQLPCCFSPLFQSLEVFPSSILVGIASFHTFIVLKLCFSVLYCLFFILISLFCLIFGQKKISWVSSCSWI